MTVKENTSPAVLLDGPMHALHDLLDRLIDSGLTPAEARDALCAMVGRVLAVHPATAPVADANE